MSYVDGKPMWNADAKKTGKPTTPVVHKKGCQEMEGWAALDYSRQRYGLHERRLRPPAEPAAADQGDGQEGHRRRRC